MILFLLGSRKYRDYTSDKLEEAIEVVADGSLTIREASRRFAIPYGTIYNKFKGKHGNIPGRPTVFTKQEELAILEAAAKCSDWGFPLNLLDLRMMAKYYLDRKGKNVGIFKNNVPGIDWTYSLLNRQKDSFGQRLATNIKRARAAVSRQTLEAFYTTLENTIQDLPSSNIFNYDESNLADDPGKKRGVYRRGVKYPGKVMNHSKSCTTVMICGAADGTLLPPYVIFKSLHLYDSWKKNAPRGLPCCDKPCCNLGTRFNRTASGWMDGATFRDWFKSCFLLHAKRLDGRKVIIGDNLSSHMDVDVLNMCSDNDIDFVCLAPNSTHLCQPLDVGFFRPMKEAWRNTLSTWKLQNIRLSTVPKDTFASLLKKTLNHMDAKPARVSNQTPRETNNIQSAVKRNLINAFRCSGIYPLDRQQVFKKLPPEAENEESDPTLEVETALTALLKEQRFGESTRPQRKKKRLDVAPGCSISTAVANNTARGNLDSDEEDIPPNTIPILSTSTSNEELSRAFVGDIKQGQYVLVKFSSRKGRRTYKYMCQIMEVNPEIVVIGLKSIRRCKKKFKLINEDVSTVRREDIIEVHNHPLEEVDADGNVFFVFETDIGIVEA